MIRRAHLALLTALIVPPAGALLGFQDPDDPEGVQEQDPDLEGDDEENVQRDVFGRVRPLRAKSHPMLGAWRLLDLAVEGYPEVGLQAEGYLLIAEDFVAFEMHASWNAELSGGLEDGFQSFIAEYTLIGGSILSCRTLIGSWLDEEDEELKWEPAGFPREFLMEVNGGLLTLRWDGGDRMTFGRKRASARARNDIFGSPEALRPSKHGPDVFGREDGRGDDDDDKR